MRKVTRQLFGTLIMSGLVLSGAVQAEEKKQDALPDAKASIQAGLQQLHDAMRVTDVRKTPVDGVYLVTLNSGELIYSSKDGQYIFSGDLLKVEKGRVDNLTGRVRGEIAMSRLAKVDTKDMIVFSPEGKARRVMYVFTDVDCGYCRKLHQEVPELNRNGVEVRYLAFPRGGVGASAYSKMVSAWCAKDRKKALTSLKAGASVPEASCDNPVKSQYQLGESLGVRGTPAIYLDDGQSVPGYQPAPALLQLLGLAAAPQS